MAGDAPRDAADRTLYAGWAQADITPDRPVNLIGQMEKRIARAARDPLTATALALEARADGERPVQAILVSCDLLGIPRPALLRAREALAPLVPGFDVGALVLNATHTHTAPGLVESHYTPYDTRGDTGVMQPAEYAELFAGRVARAASEAWRNRSPSAVGWGLGFASVGTNRRACYASGRAAMYGRTAREDFVGVEGSRDDAVELLYFWGADGRLLGVVVNIACTSQETETLCECSADFWHDTREAVRQRLGPEVLVLPQCAAAGDQSPHPIYRARAEEVMQTRRGLTRRQELARRIVSAVEDVMPLAAADAKRSLVFRHDAAMLDLPERVPPAPPFIDEDPVHPVAFHVMRLGDVALATNPFELYLDYGTRIKARSRAELTLVVQLACMDCGYLPTERAILGGGYSAEQYLVGPEGGRRLVDETVARINAMW